MPLRNAKPVVILPGLAVWFAKGEWLRYRHHFFFFFFCLVTQSLELQIVRTNTNFLYVLENITNKHMKRTKHTKRTYKHNKRMEWTNLSWRVRVFFPHRSTFFSELKNECEPSEVGIQHAQWINLGLITSKWVPLLVCCMNIVFCWATT